MSDREIGLRPRLAAFKALRRIMAGETAETALGDECKAAGLDNRDTPLMWAISMAVLRNRGLLDRALDRFIEPDKTAGEVREILRIGAAQLILLDRIPPHAAVSTSVDIAREIGKGTAGGLVNAVLRKIVGLDIGDIELPRNVAGRISVRYSHPRWLVERWVERRGREFAGALAAANNVRPPLMLRANVRRISPNRLSRLFEGNGILTRTPRHFPEYIEVEAPGHPSELPGFSDGLFSVQDPAFSVPVDILNPLFGERILEIGCAPGGKLTHLAERFGGDIALFGVDISPERLRLAEDNLRRLGLSEFVTLRESDARGFGETGTFDGVLIDAPCSSLGVIRRHPEIRYRRKMGDITKMSIIQKSLLEAGLKLLKPGGRLVYCACSTEPEEGEWHLRGLPANIKIDPANGFVSPAFIEDNVIRTWPHLSNLDGMVAFTLTVSK